MAKPIDIVEFLARHEIIPESQARQQLSLLKGNELALLCAIVHDQPNLKERLGKLWGDHLDLAYVNLDRTLVNYDIVRLLPKEFALRAHLVPVIQFGNVLTVACAHPEQPQLLAEAENYVNCFVSPVFSFPDEIDEFIHLAYQSVERLAELLADHPLLKTDNPEETLSRSDLEAQAGSQGIIEFVDGLFMLALQERASDIHLEPAENQVRIRFRIDGVLHDKMMLDNALLAPVVSRLKIMCSLDIAERRLPQDGRYAHKLPSRTVDVRVSIVPTINGEKVVMRLLGHSHSQKSAPELHDLGLSIRLLHGLHQVAARRNGIFLVTGPTGSGKTTTLFAQLGQINAEQVNIMTVEDPVEYRLDRANQVQVNTAVGLTFAKVLRAFLRQDPDIILVGEIRDEETARIAVQAALTGHLVLATLHTNSALQAIGRLVDIGIEPFLAAPATIGVMAQRLVRRLCPHCRESYSADEDDLQRYLVNWRTHAPIAFHRNVGCRMCNHTGYHGQVAIAELFILDDQARRIIARGDPPNCLEDYALSTGFKPMLYDALLKVLLGMTTLAEIERVLGLGDTSLS